MSEPIYTEPVEVLVTIRTRHPVLDEVDVLKTELNEWKERALGLVKQITDARNADDDEQCVPYGRTYTQLNRLSRLAKEQAEEWRK